MLLLPFYLFLFATIVSGYLATRKHNVRVDKELREFPGTYLLPWIGRIHDLPINFMWLKFKERADIYGPIYNSKMLGATFIVVSDEQMAEELLVKGAKRFSDRPVVQSLFDSKSTHGSMEYLPLMSKNKYWAQQRKFTHAYLTQASNNRYYGVMSFEIKRFLWKLCEEPDNFSFLIEDMTSKIMCQLAWNDTSFSAYMALVYLIGLNLR